MTAAGATAGYRRLTAGKRVAVVREAHVADAKALLDKGSLYDAAVASADARPLQGRGIAYAIELPVTRIRAVVRHNRHGGLLAPLTRDLFLPPTRAAHELVVTRRLQAAGVRVPDVLMFAAEPVLNFWRRVDVVTLEIRDGRDLSTYMLPGEPPDSRALAWEAARELVRALNDVGARHHDLNVKNILIAPSGDGVAAWVLDVDRVELGRPNARGVRVGNVGRLRRSARKWRDERGAEFDEAELAI